MLRGCVTYSYLSSDCTIFFFLMIRRPPRSTLTHSFPTRRSSDLLLAEDAAAVRPLVGVEPLLEHPGDDGARVEHQVLPDQPAAVGQPVGELRRPRSEEHTSELQSLMRISYAVFCLKKKIKLQAIKTDVRLDNPLR